MIIESSRHGVTKARTQSQAVGLKAKLRLKVIARLRGDPTKDPWKVQGYTLLADAIAQSLTGAETVIDLGCGDGLFTSELKNRVPTLRSIVGMDLAPSPFWVTDDVTRFSIGDAEEPPFAPKAVDAVVAKDLLHHMDHASMGIRRMLGLAKRTVVIIEANRDNPIMNLYTRYNGDRHLSSSELRSLLIGVAPNVNWRFESAVSYPFYLPPVGGLEAVWVWPVTGLMLLLFKVFRSRSGARVFASAISRARLAAPFTVATATLD